MLKFLVWNGIFGELFFEIENVRRMLFWVEERLRWVVFIIFKWSY